METAKIATSLLSGDKLYQKRARVVLPYLVRQAKAAQKIYYSDLAKETNIQNPRNLNYPLGSIGNALKELSKRMGIDIPQIQTIVVSKSNELPGEGIGWFISKSDFKKLSSKQKRELVNSVLAKVFAFTRWDDVLKELGLSPLKSDPKVIEALKKTKSYGSGGESEDHKYLKELIAQNPSKVNLFIKNSETTIEYILPSMDTLDVSFKTPTEWICVEVKSKLSGTEDILRGLYQCVKYQALMEAHLNVLNEHCDVKVILALGGKFPGELLSVKNLFGVEVIDDIAL